MKRKFIFWGVIIFILFTLSFFGYKTYEFESIKKKASKLAQKLPTMNFKFSNYNADSIEGKVIIVNYFSPDCNHCEYMVKKIIERKESFKKTHIFMISPAGKLDIESFVLKYKIDNLHFISIARDTSYGFFKTFGSSIIPSFYIYNSKHELDTIIKGETKIENLLKPLQ